MSSILLLILEDSNAKVFQQNHSILAYLCAHELRWIYQVSHFAHRISVGCWVLHNALHPVPVPAGYATRYATGRFLDDIAKKCSIPVTCSHHRIPTASAYSTENLTLGVLLCCLIFSRAILQVHVMHIRISASSEISSEPQTIWRLPAVSAAQQYSQPEDSRSRHAT